MSRFGKILNQLNESEVNEATDYSKAWTVKYEQAGGEYVDHMIIYADSVRKGKSKSIIINDDIVINLNDKVLSVKKGR